MKAARDHLGVGSMLVFVGCIAAGGAAGCAAADYEPETVRHRLPLTADDFDRVVEVVRQRYRRIEEMNAERFRVQSGWLPVQPADVPGFRRASVYRDEDGQLRVLVEAYFVRLGSGGPEKTPIEGDWRAEQELAGAIERALEE